MRLLVAGGRYFGTMPPDTRWCEQRQAQAIASRQRTVVFDAISEYADQFGRDVLHIIQGDCPTGADLVARECARVLRIGIEGFPANWNAYGRSAGPRRNQEMIDRGLPDEALIFPGGAGTQDMVFRLVKAGIKITRRAD